MTHPLLPSSTHTTVALTLSPRPSKRRGIATWLPEL